MEHGELLRELATLAAVLVGARIAAEIAERFGQPGVLAEILAGILLGPSVIGLIEPTSFLEVLGEVGAVLLLFEVGLHMDLDELRSVGGDALRVAGIGMLAPAALAYPLLLALGIDRDASIFLAAAFTATSVGITARVFAEMRVLAWPEARTVLGAAVADDVGGLLVLTVITQTLGTAAAGGRGLAATMVLSLGFVVAAAIVGVFVLPRALDLVARHGRTEGALVVAGVAVALGVGAAGAWTGLAPLIGAFIAGTAIARARRVNDLQRRLAPVAQTIVPVFFVVVGLHVDVGAFAEWSTIGIAVLLTAVAVIGKIVAGAGVLRGSADRLLVGIGMVPRGEVGLIFAGIGLTSGILAARDHATLVLVVLLSTLVTPPVLRWRVARLGGRGAGVGTDLEPAGGWLDLTGPEVKLRAVPSEPMAIPVAIRAALACDDRRPSLELRAWLGDATFGAWDEDGRRALLALLRSGSDRAWRVLASTRALAGMLPRIAAAAPHHDEYGLDASGTPWHVVEDLRASIEDPRTAEAFRDLERPELALLAALALGTFDEERVADDARGLATDLGFATSAVARIVALVADLAPFERTADRAGGEETILELAAHLGSEEHATGVYLLAVARARGNVVLRERLDSLFDVVRRALDHPEILGSDDLVEAYRTAAQRRLKTTSRERLRDAPRRYLLLHSPETVARHLALADPPPHAGEVRLDAEPLGDGRTKLHVVTRDAPGLLAKLATALHAERLRVVDAAISTFPDGLVVDVFTIAGTERIDPEAIRYEMEHLLDAIIPTPAPIEGTLAVDNDASPWHSVVEVRAVDQHGILARVASAIASIGCRIVHASVATVDGTVLDRFFVVGPSGHKLTAKEERTLRNAITGSKR